MKSRVVVICIGSFWTGISLFEFLPSTVWYFLALGLVGLVFVFVGFISQKTFQMVGVFIVLVALVTSLGYARMYFANDTSNQTVESFVGKPVFIEGRIIEEPTQSSRTQKIVVDADTIIENNASKRIPARVIAFVPTHPPLSYGMHVRVLGTLEHPEAFTDEETGRVFNYPAYLKKEGISYMLSYAKITEVKPLKIKGLTSVQGGLFSLRRGFVEGLSRSVSEPYAGLAAGVVFGIDGAVSEDLEEMFRRIGLSHILVASGYNITLVAKAILRMFAKVSPWVSRTLAALGIVGFVLMTGASSATIRAGIMALIALLGEALVRRYDITRALFLAALGMTLLNPHILLRDPSFQLSFAATWGLCTIAPSIQKIIAVRFPGLIGGELISATIGTQITVLPLVLFYAGGTSPYSLLANVLALPAVPFLMIASIFAGVSGLILPVLGILVGFSVTILGWFVIHVAEFFSHLPGNFVQITFVTPFVCAILYIVVVWVAKVLERKAPHHFSPKSGAGREE